MMSETTSASKLWRHLRNYFMNFFRVGERGERERGEAEREREDRERESFYYNSLGSLSHFPVPFATTGVYICIYLEEGPPLEKYILYIQRERYTLFCTS